MAPRGRGQLGRREGGPSYQAGCGRIRPQTVRQAGGCPTRRSPSRRRPNRLRRSPPMRLDRLRRLSHRRRSMSRKTVDDESPPRSDPLESLQALTTRIEEELIALEALKLPKFLRPDVFVWPFLLLGGAVIGGLGFATNNWTLAGNRRRGRRGRRGDRCPDRAGRHGSSQRGETRRTASKSDRGRDQTGRGQQGLDQERVREQDARAR